MNPIWIHWSLVSLKSSYRAQNSRPETLWEYKKKIYPSKKVTNKILPTKSLKLSKLLLWILQRTTWEIPTEKNFWVNFIKQNWFRFEKVEEFEVHLLSTASMNIFADNTLASFKNQLPQNISLESDWRVAISEIIFPSNINNVYTDFFYHVYNLNTRNVFGVEEEGVEEKKQKRKQMKKQERK